MAPIKICASDLDGKLAESLAAEELIIADSSEEDEESAFFDSGDSGSDWCWVILMMVGTSSNSENLGTGS